MTQTLISYLTIPAVHTFTCWLLLALIVLWIFLRVFSSGRILAFRGPTGKVMVSQTAIKGLIARTCCSVEGISRPQSRIRARGGKLKLRVYIHLQGDTRLSDVSTLLQEKLDLALRQNLGIERIGKIDVIVNDIHPCKSQKPQTFSTPVAKSYHPWGEEIKQ